MRGLLFCARLRIAGGRRLPWLAVLDTGAAATTPTLAPTDAGSDGSGLERPEGSGRGKRGKESGNAPIGPTPAVGRAMPGRTRRAFPRTPASTDALAEAPQPDAPFKGGDAAPAFSCTTWRYASPIVLGGLSADASGAYFPTAPLWVGQAYGTISSGVISQPTDRAGVPDLRLRQDRPTPGVGGHPRRPTG